MNRLAGKTAIVTGGAIGIGRAFVQRMAEEGAKVAIFDVPDSQGKALVSDLLAKGHDVAIWQVDVSDEGALKSAVDAVATRFGGLNAQVNNAGISCSPKTHRSGHRGKVGPGAGGERQGRVLRDQARQPASARGGAMT